MHVPPSVALDLTATELAERLASVPLSAGIYALGVPDRPPHLSWCPNLRTRLKRLLLGRASDRAGAPSLLERLHINLATVEYWPTASRLESALILYSIARERFPADYLKKLRFRLPWFVTVTDEGAFARLSVVNRIPRSFNSQAPVLGPFRTRDQAQDYEAKVLNVFQLRRCVEILHPSPTHPGCIYGEMNQCLRPCQCAVSQGEYASEAKRMTDFLLTNGKSAENALVMARDLAAAATDFEQAAYLHKRLERVKEAAAARDAVVGEIQVFNGVALTRSLSARKFVLWTLLEGYWQEPLPVDFSSQHTGSSSLDSHLREQLRAHLAQPFCGGNRSEDLALFARWYYSSWRDGSWFPFRTLADLNYRKLVREISTWVKESASPTEEGRSC